MTGNKLSADARKRIGTMVQTTNGFEIAAVDMELRGPGELDGTRQSGVTSFILLNLTKDYAVIEGARKWTEKVLDEDPALDQPRNIRLYNYLRHIGRNDADWRRIS